MTNGAMQPERELDLLLEHYRRLSTDLDDDDLASAVRRMRLGRFADSTKLDCAGPDLSIVASQGWAKVSRLARMEDDSRPVLVDILAGLARARESVAILVAAGSGIYLGLPPAAIHWVRSVLAPGSLLEPVQAPDVAAFGGEVNGLRLTLIPSSKQSESHRQATTIPGLGRIMLTPGDDWALLIRLDPVSLQYGMRLRAALAECGTKLGARASSSRTDDLGRSVTVDRPVVQRLLEQASAQLSHLEIGEGAGLWHTTIHVAAAVPSTVDMLTSVTASLLLEEPTSGGRWVGDRLVETRKGSCPPPASLLSTVDLAALLTPPQESVPGLRVTAAPPSGRVRLPHRELLSLGTWKGVRDEFSIGVEDLEGHAFVTGTTGAGKSTTAQRLLAELWNEHGISFLVIDPVKADYESVAPVLRGELLVVDAADLRMNVLDPYPGFPSRTHLELVSNAFKGSFSLPSPVPYVVAQLFELLVDRVETEPPSTLHELRDMLDPFVTGLGYDAEVTSNIRAALGTRLSLLLSPAKAERVAAPANSMLDSLFSGPTVVALSGLGDDEERAFLTTMLTLYVYERARALGPSSQVRHVTVLEEAHRILPEPTVGSDPESGDATSVSARLLTQMLTEIRSYGEAVLVVDQSPSAVARDVVKNTNLKITHRILDPDDRHVIAGSMGMDEAQERSIGTLDRGEAIVSSRRLPGPQTVSIGLARQHPDAGRGDGCTRGLPTGGRDDDPRPCCRGAVVLVHHAAERNSLGAESAMSLAVAGLIAGGGARKALWEEVDQQLSAVLQRDAQLARNREVGLRCLAWVGLRRSLGQYLDYGAFAPHEMVKYLDVAFICWRGKRSHRLFKRLREAFDESAGPYYGCRWCDTKCHFRHFAGVSRQFGTASATAVLKAPWNETELPGKQMLDGWRRDATPTLRQFFGDPVEARGAAMCALTQVLHARGAPFLDQEDLLTRSLRPQPEFG